MVYLEPQQLGWQPLLTSWLSTLPTCLGSDLVATISGLLKRVLPPCLRFVRRSVTELSPTEPTGLATAVFRLVSAQLDEFVIPLHRAQDACDNATKADPLVAVAKAPVDVAGVSEAARIKRVEAAVIFAVTWAVGATGNAAGRAAFDAFFRKLASGDVPEVLDPFILCI
jgi:dynein heavy chain, axonemal